ncbi:NADPH:quinone oxidoreductase [Pueribacillus theae]|uniref:NADPH:quinone oxidoreductase n=1 Tax=Pueribacillus theae TaxID=2171751 RepID=A0A2U1K0I9_9BACI|nr:NAD(P)H-quinone oxidoreductase [Pueribacillus theae]PWA10689.1 NADPH:quinone oxidoreductase [Pueribacillus theae]
MKAVVMKEPGNPGVLHIGESETPEIKSGEVLIRVKATALNRADLLQRKGMYPPPKGASDILGLEAAGEVAEVGPNVTRLKKGDRVCALLPGGGYAEFAAIPAEMAMIIPENLSYEEAAGIPEVFLTAYSNLFILGRLKAGDDVLVHAGASGVGTAAIQLIREAGARVIVTAGSDEKIERCLELGAAAGWNYNNGPFREWVKEQTEGRGVDIILDFVGAPYFQDNLRSLAVDGRLIIVGTMGGIHVDNLNLGFILRSRLQIIGTALRSRSPETKIEFTKSFVDFAMERFKDGRLKPIIDSVFDWKDAAKAHEYMESNANIGKIILKVTDSE